MIGLGSPLVMAGAWAALSSADRMASAFICLSVDAAFMVARLMCASGLIAANCFRNPTVLDGELL